VTVHTPCAEPLMVLLLLLVRVRVLLGLLVEGTVLPLMALVVCSAGQSPIARPLPAQSA